MNKNELIQAIKLADEIIQKRKYRKIDSYWKDTGKYSRDKYQDALAVFKAGATKHYRGFIGGNGSGKTHALSSEWFWHMSGQYPEWWEGHRFNYPINSWVASQNVVSIRGGVQETMLGGVGDDNLGTGIVPLEDILDDDKMPQVWTLPGGGGAIGIIRIRHQTNGIFDGWSKCEFRTYEQGWSAFQGANRDLICFDEDPNDGKILAECVARLRSKDGRPAGHLIAAFTPTFGVTDTYTLFMPGGVETSDGNNPENPDTFYRFIETDKVPHTDAGWLNTARKVWAEKDPLNLQARISGRAAMGSGRVWPINESFTVVPAESIPAYYKKCFGMDPGHANFATIWLGKDPNTGVITVYDEYRHGNVVYLIHAEAIKARGDWIPGGIDPHEAVKPRDTGETVQSYFESLGLELLAAKGDPDALRYRIRSMFETGALRISSNCQQLLKAIRTYRYDMDNPAKIARGQDDHLCDALIYAVCVMDQIGKSYTELEEEIYYSRHSGVDQNDSQRSEITGY